MSDIKPKSLYEQRDANSAAPQDWCGRGQIAVDVEQYQADKRCGELRKDAPALSFADHLFHRGETK